MNTIKFENYVAYKFYCKTKSLKIKKDEFMS